MPKERPSGYMSQASSERAPNKPVYEKELIFYCFYVSYLVFQNINYAITEIQARVFHKYSQVQYSILLFFHLLSISGQ